MPTMRQNEPCDEDGTLIKATRELLRGRGLYQVHKETGVPYFWLRSFAQGSRVGPSVNRVQYLYEKLTGKALKLGE